MAGRDSASTLRAMVRSVAWSKGYSANMYVGNLIGSMLRRGFAVNSRALAVAIVRRVIVGDECFGEEEHFRWTTRDIELLICDAKKRSDVPVDEDDADALAEDAEEELIKGERVVLPKVTAKVKAVVEEVRSIFCNGRFDRLKYLQRADEHVEIGKVMAQMLRLDTLYRETTGQSKWKGYRWIPKRQREWRLNVSTSDLQSSSFFKELRALLPGLEKPTWTDVVRACAGLDSMSQLEAEKFVCHRKEYAFERICRILNDLATLGENNTQVLSDGVSFQLRVKKDRSDARREKFGWQAAPLQVRGMARLCSSLDRQLGFAGLGFLSQLDLAIKKRRLLVKEHSDERVYNWDSLWQDVEAWAIVEKINVRETFSRVMESDGDAGDTLRKSRLFAELPASVAARVVSPELLASTTVFSLDFGLVKWVGGVVVLPASGEDGGQRVCHPYTVRGGEYHHRVGINAARARREKGDATLELEAKLRRALECGKTRLFREVLRDMRKISDAAHPGRDFVVIVGDGGIDSGRGHRRPATKQFLKFLQEFVLVISMPEFNTSKCCPRCSCESVFYWDAHRPRQASYRREFRTKFCKSDSCCPAGGKGFAYDRDTAAGVNFFRIFYCMVRGWGRPAAFDRSNGAGKLSPRVVPPAPSH